MSAREPVVETSPESALTAADLRNTQVLTDGLTAEYLEYHALLPVRWSDDELDVATWKEEPDVQALDDLELMFDARLRVWRLPEPDVRAAIRRCTRANCSRTMHSARPMPTGSPFRGMRIPHSTIWSASRTKRPL
jgi:hypothetical protein